MVIFKFHSTISTSSEVSELATAVKQNDEAEGRNRGRYLVDEAKNGKAEYGAAPAVRGISGHREYDAQTTGAPLIVQETV